MKRTFYIESLGCAKNSVDSESISALLVQAGYTRAASPRKAGIILVNTCGFIEDARRESIQVLRDHALKKNKNQYLIAAGCMAHQYPDLIQHEIRGIDGLLSTRRWMDINKLLNELERVSRQKLPVLHGQDAGEIGQEIPGIPRSVIQGASAYVKIADGCQRGCAFCSIPLIKGRLVSRNIPSILEEVKALEIQKIKEIILIAQDTTQYGRDLGYKFGLEQLLESISSQITGIPWVRIMYTYPGSISERLIELFASSKQLLPYLDLPLQHAHPSVLKRMRRPADIDWTRKTVAALRAKIPHLALRTTFIVGSPGETEDEFQYLINFIHEIEFDHVGVFTYSRELGTSMYSEEDSITGEQKLERYNQLMLAQQEISLRKSTSFVGKTLEVLIEGSDSGISVGRSYRDAPEIDGMVIVNNPCPVGEIVPVKITQGLPYDLVGISQD